MVLNRTVSTWPTSVTECIVAQGVWVMLFYRYYPYVKLAVVIINISRNFKLVWFSFSKRIWKKISRRCRPCLYLTLVSYTHHKWTSSHTHISFLDTSKHRKHEHVHSWFITFTIFTVSRSTRGFLGNVSHKHLWTWTETTHYTHSSLSLLFLLTFLSCAIFFSFTRPQSLFSLSAVIRTYSLSL